jgi:anti-sigma regulatory factor (Ser/Thr protein kinase)
MPDAAPAVLRMTPARADLAKLYPWLDAAAKPFALPTPLLERMHVALEEAVMNVAMHGYREDAGGEIIVRLRIEPAAAVLQAVVLQVEDHGPPFDPVASAPAAKPARLEDDDAGGLGITLLRHFCKDISYAREGDRNLLTMRFPIQPAPGSILLKRG